jgi:hypothetical protein
MTEEFDLRFCILEKRHELCILEYVAEKWRPLVEFVRIIAVTQKTTSSSSTQLYQPVMCFLKPVGRADVSRSAIFQHLEQTCQQSSQLDRYQAGASSWLINQAKLE